MRRVASSNEFFDILDKIGNGKFVTIGYVTGANLDVPKVSRKNPLTNRMKQYPDYTVFNTQEEIGALVKITSYNFQYLNRQTVGKKYGEYKQAANGIRTNFGLDPIGDKQGYKQVNNWSPNGPELYNGDNSDLNDHSYNPQNIYGAKPKGTVYAVNKEGHIIQALSQEQIIPYFKKKREMDGVAALRKMEVEEDKIEDYINQINNLKFKYINFESNSILWIAATINGEKIVYINDNLTRAVDGIDIRPEDFRAIARERYKIDLANLHEMTMKRLKVLAEMDWRTYDAAREKAEKLASETPSRYEKERRTNQADAFRKHANSTCDKQYGIDKIKQRERDHDTEVVLNKTKAPFKYTNGELKRLDKQSRDVHDYYDGKQYYKDGKWMNKESKNVNMNKDVYRLTESELKSMIKESAMKILSELDWRTYASAAQKNDVLRKENPNHKANQWNRSFYFRNAARDAFDKKHGLDHQFDEPNSRYGGDKGSINLNAMDDFSVTGSRDHDFGDGDPHGLRHNVYHMGKKYGKDGGYGRTRMWDTAHETTPEKFYGSNEMGKKFRDAEKDAEDFTSGKSHYVNGKGWTNESKEEKTLTEAVNPIEKIQSLIQQANNAYHQALEIQGQTEWPLMDKEGNPYGLSGDIKLDGRGYIIIPFTAWQYSEFNQPMKFRVLTKAGGKIRIVNGDMWTEGWKDARKYLKQIIRDAQIGNGHFQNYDPNWENAENPDEFNTNKEALRNMNKQIGRNSNAGINYIDKKY